MKTLMRSRVNLQARVMKSSFNGKKLWRTIQSQLHRSSQPTISSVCSSNSSNYWHDTSLYLLLRFQFRSARVDASNSGVGSCDKLCQNSRLICVPLLEVPAQGPGWHARGERVEGQSWRFGPFRLSFIRRQGIWCGMGITCGRHRNPGDRPGNSCQTSLMFGENLTEAEARIRLKRWAIEGRSCRLRSEHLGIKARALGSPHDSFPSTRWTEAELDAHAETL